MLELFIFGTMNRVMCPRFSRIRVQELNRKKQKPKVFHWWNWSEFPWFDVRKRVSITKLVMVEKLMRSFEISREIEIEWPPTYSHLIICGCPFVYFD